MYPNLFGIENFSYTLCLVIGIMLSILITILFLRKKNTSKDGFIDLCICACFAISCGIIFSILFENVYELIAYGENYHWTWGMTFYGGLIGGVLGFLLTYFFLRKNVHFDIKEVLKIAPISICVAHGIGRIGCFLAGCCYGKETDSWIGIDFPHDGLGKVIPTQLIEALFLFLLSGVLVFLFLKKNFKYNFIVYLTTYSVFRFIIEYFRGDQRGVAFTLSPSQIISLIIFVGSLYLILLFKRIYKNEAQ